MLQFDFKKASLIAILVSPIFLTACGGGGGSSSSNVATQTSSGYSGSRALAKLTEANVGTFVDMAQTAYELGYIADDLLSAVDAYARPSSTDPLSPQKRLSQLAINAVKNAHYQARTINASDSCTYGGSVVVNGEINDTSGTGTLTLTLTACEEDEGIYQGSANIRVSAYDNNYDEITAATITTDGLSLTTEGEKLTLSGNIQIANNPANNTFSVTNNLLLKGSNNLQVLQENLKISQNTQGQITVSGKICDYSAGCVTLGTPVPFTLALGAPYTGTLVLYGDKSSLRMKLTRGNLQLDLDSNGDGTFETPVQLNT